MEGFVAAHHRLIYHFVAYHAVRFRRKSHKRQHAVCESVHVTEALRGHPDSIRHILVDGLP